MQNKSINIDAVRQVCGNQNRVMLYGFHYLLYGINTHIEQSLLKNKFTVHNFRITPDGMPYVGEDRSTVKRKCKRTLTRTLLYNYRLEKEGKPLIPLIFCLGASTKDYSFKVDYFKVATSSSTIITNLTDAELRRIYKLYLESPDELKVIMEKSFHFFDLTDNQSDQKEPYRLEEVLPIWKQPDFLNGWKNRVEYPYCIGRRLYGLFYHVSKWYPWRDEFRKAIEKIQSRP